MSKQFSQNVNIKSKYLGLDEVRELIIDPQRSQISISQSGNPKQYKEFHIDQLEDHTEDSGKVSLIFDNGREYQINSKNPQIINKAITHTKHAMVANKFKEESVQMPRQCDYTKMSKLISQEKKARKTAEKQNMKIGQSNNKILEIQETFESPFKGISSTNFRSQIRPSLFQEKQILKKRQGTYKRVSHYQRPQDFILNANEGTLEMVNQQWASNTAKIFSFVVKKFLSSGSFMGISLPAFSLKGQSILQSYGKSVAAAPHIISYSKDPIERFKHFMCFMWSFSLIQVAIVKPFNPTIGQTYQADIGGGRYSAEQVVHHPPISAFHYRKDNYTIYASLELAASIGINSGDGRFVGDITLQYDDGYWVKGKLPNGKMTGILVGTTTFQPYGGSYAYDSNNIVLTYKLQKNNNFQGYLGMLKAKPMAQFRQTLTKQNRFVSFKPYEKDKYSKIISEFKARYTQWVQFDSKQYINLNDKKVLPYALMDPFDKLLPSDSRFRKDIALRKQGKMEEAQEQKQRIENEQRAFRKLRQKYNKEKGEK